MRGLVCFLLCLMMLGCETSPKPPTDSGSLRPTHGATSTKALTQDFQPVLGSGLTLHRFVVPVGDPLLDTVFTKYGQEPDSIALERLDSLRMNGFEVYAVDVSDLSDLVAELPFEQTIESRWIGQANQWSDITSAGPVRHERMVEIDGQLRQMWDGTFRYLMRGYPIQTIDGPIYRLELIPLFYQPDLWPMSGGSGELEQLPGVWISSVGATYELDGSQAIVLTVDSSLVIPNVVLDETDEQEDTVEGAESEPIDESTEESTEEIAPEMNATIPVMGPDPFPVLTVGETLFGSGMRNRKLVLVFVPWVGERGD